MARARGTIVVAWFDAEERRVTGRPAAHAAVWKRRGYAKDVERAEEYARTQTEGGRVIVYPREERDPLGRARREILASIDNPNTERQ
jgi:hypothetical protein